MGIRTILPRLRQLIFRTQPHPDASWLRLRPGRAGPPAVAIARAHASGNLDIAIEPFETDFRVENGRVAVRAWIALPSEGLSSAWLTTIEDSARKLHHLPQAVRKVLFLSTAYGLTTAEIAVFIGISRWRARRMLLRGLAALDGRALTRTDRHRAVPPPGVRHWPE